MTVDSMIADCMTHHHCRLGRGRTRRRGLAQLAQLGLHLVLQRCSMGIQEQPRVGEGEGRDERER